jgi:hypothetical protein
MMALLERQSKEEDGIDKRISAISTYVDDEVKNSNDSVSDSSTIQVRALLTSATNDLVLNSDCSGSCHCSTRCPMQSPLIQSILVAVGSHKA